MSVGMDSMRNSLQRSRDSALKKPRLAEDQSNPSGGGRSFAQRPTPARLIRGAGDDSNDVGAYHPQPLQQSQELVNQYKTALAELTFNSKPIITNLTIIAGENVLHARDIAAVICKHIIEVPSEQKLPALYLLDSIVKNLGIPYAKHFGQRLIEVFCKAYRQVEPPVQSSMRHLFGTWRSVFPLQLRQMIEKELGFSSSSNGSSAGTVTSRSDAQSQQPQHSIHVNPKYLERQQRLQQSVRVPIADSPEEFERPERSASIVSSLPWTDSAVKIHNIQRSQRAPLSDPIEEKSRGTLYGDFDYGNDASRNSGLGSGRIGARDSEQGHGKSWYGAAGAVPKKLSDPRIGYGMKHRVPDHSIPKSIKAAHLQPTKSIARRTDNNISTSWKNSEEEEFTWDMHSRLPDHNAEKLGNENNVRRSQIAHEVVSRFDRESSSDSLSTEHSDLANIGNHSSSPWPWQEATSMDDLVFSDSGTNSSYAEGKPALHGGLPSRIATGAHVGTPHVAASNFEGLGNASLNLTGTRSQHRFPSTLAAPPSPPRQTLPSTSLPSRYPPRQLPISADQDYQSVLPQSQSKVHQSSRSLLPPNAQLRDSTKSPPEELRPSSLAVVSGQQVQQYPFSNEQQLNYELSESSGPSQKKILPLKRNAGALLPSGLSESNQSIRRTAETSGQSSTSSLLAAVMKSGVLSAVTAGGLASKSLQNSGHVTSKADAKPPLLNRPPPSQLTPTRSRGATASATATTLCDAKKSSASIVSCKKEEQQRLSPVPPSPQTKTPKVGDKVSNPISNLLSSLLVKGLIKSEVSPVSSSDMTIQPEKQEETIVVSKSAPVSSLPEPASTTDGESLEKTDAKGSIDTRNLSLVTQRPAAKESSSLPQSIPVEIGSLIGLKFKSDVIRAFHPAVIDCLFDDLPHQCNVCGLRLKLKEELDKHLEWHTENETDPLGTRRWYAQIEDWIFPNPKPSIPSVSNSPERGGSQSVTDHDDPMVPADEDQSICVLCGELFEDYYSPEGNRWMFRGAMHMALPLGNGEQVDVLDSRKRLLVHLRCPSEGSPDDLGLEAHVKMKLMLVEMDSVRNSLQRSRESALKKPRLAEDQSNPSGGGRPFAQRPTPARLIRGAGDDSNDVSAYHPQPLQQSQELVNQYKTALAELTFNSKPIITNLTIIAGENVLHARDIAAVICKHIIEVFCKAYRQVEPPVQSSMRHLFGTWRSVFPLQLRQMIEKELGFSSASNGSSTGTVTSRSDSQSQQPQHSIHVNPKYLERQQRLQQSVREPIADTPEEFERPERSASIVASRPWTDSAVKIHNIQRSQRAPLSDPIEEKSRGALYGDFDYGNDASRNSGLGSGRIGARGSEQGHGKSWYGVAGAVPEKLSDPRNGYNMKHRELDHLIPKSIKAAHLQPTESIGRRRDNSISTSWKNSEEEEFTWDMHPRLPDQDAEKLGIENHVRRSQFSHEVVSRFDRESSSDSLSTEHSDRANIGNHSSSPWTWQEATSMDDLVFSDSGTNSSYAEGKSGMHGGLPSRVATGAHAGPPHVAASSFGGLANASLNLTGTRSQHRLPSIGAATSSQQSPPRQTLSSTPFPSRYTPRQLPVSADQDYQLVLPQSQSKVHQSSRSLLPPNNQLRDLNKLPAVSGQQVQQYPFSHEQQLDYELSESSGPSQKRILPLKRNAGALLPSGLSESNQSIRRTAETSSQSSTSSLLAAVMKSGVLSAVTAGGLASKSLQNSGHVTSKADAKPPLLNGPPPSQLTSSRSRGAIASATAPTLCDAKSSVSIVSRKKEEQQRLSPVPPSPLTKTSKVIDNVSNPISNLLSSLLVKGLIKSEVSPVSSSDMAIEPENWDKSNVVSKSAPVSSPPEPASTTDGESLEKTDAKGSIGLRKSTPVAKESSSLPQSILMEIESLIGLKFKSDVIRAFHPAVIDCLFDDLPHQCNLCGLRFKLKEGLDKHLEWHSENETDPLGARRWYAQIEDWICPNPKPSIPSVSNSPERGGSQSVTDHDDPMVPADEDQSICVLCGELFEDYYSPEGNRWMFRGAMHMALPLGNSQQVDVLESRKSLLVHLHCPSEGSPNDLGLEAHVKMEI
ncbi:Polyadenylation and cleavage factor homolog 4 [Linum perenne]